MTATRSGNTFAALSRKTQRCEWIGIGLTFSKPLLVDRHDAPPLVRSCIVLITARDLTRAFRWALSEKLAIHASPPTSLSTGQRKPGFEGKALRSWRSAGDPALRAYYRSDAIFRNPELYLTLPQILIFSCRQRAFQQLAGRSEPRGEKPERTFHQGVTERSSVQGANIFSCRSRSNARKMTGVMKSVSICEKNEPAYNRKPQRLTEFSACPQP